MSTRPNLTGIVDERERSQPKPRTMRRFPAPWTVEQIPGGYKVLDANGQSLTYVYGANLHGCSFILRRGFQPRGVGIVNDLTTLSWEASMSKLATLVVAVGALALTFVTRLGRSRLAPGSHCRLCRAPLRLVRLSALLPAPCWLSLRLLPLLARTLLARLVL